MNINTAKKHTNNNHREDLSRWADEGGAPVEAETVSTNRPVADNRALPSSNLGLETEGGVHTTKEEEEELPTIFRMFFRTFLPIVVAIVAAAIALMSQGSVKIVFTFVAALGFAWFALQLAWVEKEPNSR